MGRNLVEGLVVTGTAAAVGGVIAGVVLQWNQQRLDRKAARKRYEGLRSALVKDLVHDLKVFHRIFAEAMQPYHKVGAEVLAKMYPTLSGERPIVLAGGKDHPIHLETWDLAKDTFAAMTDEHEAVVRFARAFQAIRDTLVGSEPAPSAPLRGFYRERHSLHQRNAVTLEGNQIRTVPAAVFGVFFASEIHKEMVTLVVDYGTDDDAEWASSLPEIPPMMDGGWTGIDAVAFVPKGIRQEAPT